MKLQNVKRNLARAGLQVQEITIMCNGKETPALDVCTDYSGPYPTAETLQQVNTAERIAARAGAYSEQRGYKTAVWIWQK